jgi:glucose/arabinose dehydrogenase
MKHLTLASLTVLSLLFACEPAPRPAADPGQAAPPPAPPEPPEEHVPPPPPAPTQAEEVGVRILSGVGFKTPESVFYDAAQDVYFVSNINGNPSDRDDNGFISKVTPDGEVTLEFVSGSRPDVQLNAPKGMTVVGGTLYVADIDQVATFNATTGAPKEVIKVPGATFLNDVASAPDGTIYFTDSGLKPDFSPSGTDAVYKLEKNKPVKLAADPKLGNPNGLTVVGDKLWVVTFGSGSLYSLDRLGKADGTLARQNEQKMSQGKLDGLVALEDGSLYVTSWEGKSVSLGKPGSAFVEVVTGLESPADMGYDSKRHRLLIPLFLKDAVVLHLLAAQSTSP